MYAPPAILEELLLMRLSSNANFVNPFNSRRHHAHGNPPQNSSSVWSSYWSKWLQVSSYILSPWRRYSWPISAIQHVHLNTVEPSKTHDITVHPFSGDYCMW